MAGLDYRRILRLIRWSVFALAVAGALWMRAHFIVLRPQGLESGLWDVSSDRTLLVERLGEGEVPARRRVVVFADERGRRRLARVLGLPGEPLGEADGKITVNDESIGLEAPDELRPRVPDGYLLVAADDPALRARSGAPLVPLEAVVGVVLVEFPF